MDPNRLYDELGGVAKKAEADLEFAIRQRDALHAELTGLRLAHEEALAALHRLRGEAEARRRQDAYRASVAGTIRPADATLLRADEDPSLGAFLRAIPEGMTVAVTAAGPFEGGDGAGEAA